MGAITIIGGNKYRWRGKSIRTVRKNNVTCVTMPRKDSIVMAPSAIISGAKYKITITASRNSGNGALLVNFFGGKHYDGGHIPVSVTKAEMQEYSVFVTAPKVPENIPMFLRVWRPSVATGNVYLKTIVFKLIDTSINVRPKPEPEPQRVRVRAGVKHPRPRKQKISKIPEKPKVRKKVIPVIRESKEMRFKPYKVKSSRADVGKVLIRNPEDAPKVSIITPTRDCIEFLKKCYKALGANTCYPNWEWIVGDSVSLDGTAEYIKGLQDSRIKLVERGTTEGSFSSINNELVEFATGEYLLFLNDDTEPQPFWLFEMVTKIHKNPDVGVVGARLMYSHNKVQHAGIAFIPQGPANLGKSVLKSFPVNFANYDRYYQAVTGACLLISKEDFKSVGCFDNIYHFCYEDVDLCLKVKKQLNKRVLYASNAVVLHAESVTQRKYRTGGELQKAGIQVFKERWMKSVEVDFPKFQHDLLKGVRKVDVSFVTCVNDTRQYRDYILASLFKNKTSKYYETIPILNFGNPYSAAQALNMGLEKTKGEIIVFCHQDVVFYENWIDILFERIKEVEQKNPNWGVLGTAGINKREDTVGVVYNLKGKIQWEATKRTRIYPMQTCDEHCMIIRKSSKLRFDAKTFNGFHFYGPDLCLNAHAKGMGNFGILNPLVHNSASGSLISGKKEFVRLLNALATKWRPHYRLIRTPTSIIRRKSVRTFVNFRK